MKKTAAFALAALVVSFVFSSCAENQNEDLEKKQMASFDAWMALYGEGAEKQPSGIYVKKLNESPSGETPTDNEWVMINYTGRDMTSGDVYVSRDPIITKQQGTFQYYTHYVPQYMQYARTNTSMIEGVYEALAGMKEGDKWRVYIPSSMAYGSGTQSFSGGYEGASSVRTNMPVLMDLELVKVIANPTEYEETEVADYAGREWNKPLTDTLAANMYFRTLSTGSDTAHVRRDSLVSVYYTGQFLDGFVFDTNIEEVAREHDIYDSDSDYEPLSVTVGSGSVIDGFDSTLVAMKYGEKAQAVFTSAYGYGSEGSTSGNTVIQPYTPLLFTIEVAPYKGDGTEEYPYTPIGVNTKISSETNGQWVSGYIVGTVQGSQFKADDETDFSKETEVKTNLILGERTNSKSAAQCIVIELPEGEIRDALNLADNESLYLQKITVFGNITMNYLGVKGVTGITEYTE